MVNILRFGWKFQAGWGSLYNGLFQRILALVIVSQWPQ